MKVLIAGAGIGGLTAALCCLQRGMDVQVFERASELGEVGAGIQLPPNAMKVFARLGLTELLKAAAYAPAALETRLGADGRKIFSVPVDESRWGGEYLNIHRADYIEILKTALLKKSPKALNLNHNVKSYISDTESVTAVFIDGSTVSGDVLIGADGIHSAVREQMFGPDKPRFTGNVAWRATVPSSALSMPLKATSCAWFGRGKHAVTYPLRGGSLVNFVGVVERDDPLEEGWKARGEIAKAREDFKGWAPYISDVLKAVSAESLYQWGLYDRAPFESWYRGRAVLLGDSVHPMLPFMAQGAAMAVEDAWILAQALAQDETVAHAFKSYEAQRKPRASMVQAASRSNMKTFHKSTTIGQIMTYGPMWLAGSYAPSIIRKRLDKFYAYDVTGNGR